ncbi:MAG TPA: ABC transporter ATP-binding protein [Edaphocola sp.]|nr:ABC transporter ATP-binding protein [Edaphocola sp.]
MVLLEAKNIDKSYGNLQVLKNVSLQIKKGEFVAIMGPSGAGKSTLLHLLGMLDKADKGSIVISQTDINKLNANKQAAFRNKHIGFVFQSHHLLQEFTALENVCMPMWIAGMERAEAAKKAEEILAMVGLSHRIHHKPSALSGGEQQRVAIARAVAQAPEIIFADEPTGNLDTTTAEEINKLFLDLVAQNGLTLVVVTHNEQLADLADRTLHMRDGMMLP